MKVMTVLGTRPEIIRLSQVIPLLDALCDHILVFTGQNFDPNLCDIFFDQLGVRAPDHRFECQGSSAMAQVGVILAEVDALLERHKPERFLVLGDTNSALSTIAAKRRGIPVFHMEAGNRCFDPRVPEEVNRRIIDHSSDVLMPYTVNSRDHLLREGFAANRVYVTGNPIHEVLTHYAPQIESSDVLTRLGATPGGYFLVTLHRAENVDLPDRLDSFLEGLIAIHSQYSLPVLLSLHPRTRSRLQASGRALDKGVVALEPPGFFDFVHLEKNARAVLSDSGTVQEEGCIFGIPTVTLRDVTERPETMEAGSNILTGCEPEDLLRALRLVLEHDGPWVTPAEYLAPAVSRTVAKLLFSHWS
ncbi:UDP-N-acetylglucosamine 2-epimerase [Solidesulfovibrio fructosivorans JJ]]|uniref:UDP-N-acetylglucosamine 2-epimerase n=2 Tax=Solidesulfovibrio fructosivorans TaxID=878 RepID=E1JXP0_SOLFR|nr:UDP-N-acetylglucosamine 2-epimerase [Solidesulfovibrio fructosivorans JJ]]